MTHRLGRLAASAAFLSTVASSGCAPTVGAREAPAQNATVLALTDVTVIDPAASDPRRPNQTVVIEAGRITSVGPRDSVRIPANARHVEAAGRYLIPGLWDAHVHFMNTGVTALPLLVANGVTSVREMGGFLDSSRAWQARMRTGTLIGPRIITPGVMLESPRYLAGVRERSARLGGRLAPRVLPYRVGIADSADAQRVVDSLKALRVDFVKFRTVVSAQALFAILREAHRTGLSVAGHIPGVVPIAVAADSGQDDIEHALLVTDTATRAAITRAFVSRRTWYTPTLVVSRAVTIPGDSAERLVFDPRVSEREHGRPYASDWLLGWWRMQIDERKADTANAGARQAARAFVASQEDVRAFAAAGVRLLAGTDAGSVLVYPGFSLHEELALLVQAGLTPTQALWSATAGPAEFARLQASVGRIAAGYVADLVLLDADPLADIANTRRIRAVVQGGRLYDRATLDSLLTGVRRQTGTR